MERDAIFGTISPSVSSFISNNICLTQNQQKIIFNKTKPDFMNLAWSTQSVRHQNQEKHCTCRYQETAGEPAEDPGGGVHVQTGVSARVL